MLHSMAIRLIHVHQLETFYLCYGVKCQSGVIFQPADYAISRKMAKFVYVTVRHGHKTHTCSSA